jgi:2-oxoisovalerate dehydrogenase E2 component (dihydrolipoyl transacylase)
MPQLTMPNVGEGVTEGTVTRWLRAQGDDVALDEPVVEIETDKAVVEVPSPFAGKLLTILVQEGQTVPIGAPLAEFSGADATEQSAVAATPTVETVAAATADDAAESTSPATGARGARLSPPAPVLAPSSRNGAVVGEPPERRRTRQYSPVVMRLAEEHDIDLKLVRGTGIEGRVTRQDVMRYLENPALHTVAPGAGEGVVGAEKRSKAAGAPSPAPAPAPRAPAAPAHEGAAVPLSATRRTIAAHMTESHRTIPSAWMTVEADVTGLVALRERVKKEFLGSEGVKLTFMPFFVQAIVGALKQHPALNASYSEKGVTQHARQHIGIAVATDSGLIVPVVRDAGDKSIAGLARELEDVGERARSRKLTIEELRGATFTIDNTGAFGSVLSQPIVPVGQVAIVTTEAIRRELRPVGDGFAVRSVMNLCISIDHRALDGAEAGAFMAEVRRRLEAYEPAQPLY